MHLAFPPSCTIAAAIVTLAGLAAAPQPSPSSSLNQPTILPLSQPAAQPIDSLEAPQPEITPALAADAWDDERWADAANYYRVLSRDNPDEALFAFRLAYALHADGQYRRAIQAHQAAAEFDQYRPVALYNLGCAHAILGNTDEAFESLATALDEGFDDQDQMERDPDLFTLHDDPRWQRLLSGDYEPDRPTGPGTQPAQVSRDVAFLLGEWEVLDPHGQRLGSLSIHPDLDGAAIVIQHRPDDSEPALTLLAYDGVLEAWRSITITSDGGITDLAGEAGRDSLQLEGEVHTADGQTILQQVTVEMNRDGTVAFNALESEGDGDSWRPVHSAVWRRLGIVPPTYPAPTPGNPRKQINPAMWPDPVVRKAGN